MSPAATEEFAGVTAIEVRLGAAPVPLNGTVCGLLFALSLKVSVPLREPCAFGEKVTEAVQLAPAARLLGQVEVTVKSLGLLETLVTVNAVDWLLVRITVCGALDVPIAWLAKVNGVGLATAATTPFPVRLTVGLTLALSLIVSVPIRVPATAGVKKTEIVQLLPADKVLGGTGQVLVVVKSARLVEVLVIDRDLD